MAQQANDIGLLDERQIREIWAALGSRNVPLDDLLQLLVRREYMTNYQVERIVKGERSGFFFGPYKVLYLVGMGTFARVFRAVHAKTGAVMAIKALRTRYSENQPQYSQFLREGRVGCTLRHPNIVPIFDVVSQGKHHFLVMEFVEGWNLQNFVKIRKKVDPRQAVKLMIEMTEGLRYAFEHGLTHRDLKLNNVLVSSSGQAKLVDFGLAADGRTPRRRRPGRPAEHADDRLCGLGAGDRRPQGRHPQRHLLPRLHLLSHADRPGALSETKDRLQRLSKQRFLEVTPIQQRRSVAAALGDARGQQGDDARPQPSLPIALGALGRPAHRRNATGCGECRRAGVGHGRGRRSAEKQASVMVVESNQHMQDVFRDAFKKAGYRVLVTSDPVRAVARLPSGRHGRRLRPLFRPGNRRVGAGVVQPTRRGPEDEVCPRDLAFGRAAAGVGEGCRRLPPIARSFPCPSR